LAPSATRIDPLPVEMLERDSTDELLATMTTPRRGEDGVVAVEVV